MPKLLRRLEVQLSMACSQQSSSRSARKTKTVEIILTDAVLTVLRVNSNQNDLSHAGRNNEATAIAVIASKAMSEDATAASIGATLHAMPDPR